MRIEALLAAVEEAAPVGVVDTLGQELVRTVDADHVALLIANFSGSALVRMSHVPGGEPERDGRNERTETVPLPGTVYERVVFSQVREVVRDGDKWLALIPVTERGDAIGVLEVAFSREPESDTLGQLVAVTHALAYALIASRRHTDLFEWAQRDIPFSIAAEIQRRLLPSAYTVEAGPLSLAGWLESPPMTPAVTRSTTRSTVSTPTPRSPMQWGTPPPPRCWPRSPWARCATAAAPGPPRLNRPIRLMRC